MDKLTAVVLAAGEGKRMRSRQPKVLHPLCGRPLIAYPLRAARTLADRVVLVVGPNADAVVELAGPDVRSVVQRERLGSGHAVLQARPECADGTILVLPGDMPLLSVETIERLVAHHRKSRAAATVLTAVVPEPQGYGRVLRQGGRVKRIVEDRDATDAEKKIAEINTSVYCFDGRRLWQALGKIRPDNDQGEYYLTDVIGVLSRAGARGTRKPYCVLTESVVEDAATLGPFCHLRPLSHVGPKARIGNFVELKKSRIGRGSKVPHLSYVGDATVGEDVNVGAGTITCNYDGVAKHKTKIDDRAFIGTNTSLVAPVTVGEGAYIGAGSTITKDVPPGALGWDAPPRSSRTAGPPGRPRSAKSTEASHVRNRRIRR